MRYTIQRLILVMTTLAILCGVLRAASIWSGLPDFGFLSQPDMPWGWETLIGHPPYKWPYTQRLTLFVIQLVCLVVFGSVGAVGMAYAISVYAKLWGLTAAPSPPKRELSPEVTNALAELRNAQNEYNKALAAVIKSVEECR